MLNNRNDDEKALEGVTEVQWTETDFSQTFDKISQNFTSMRWSGDSGRRLCVRRDVKIAHPPFSLTAHGPHRPPNHRISGATDDVHAGLQSGDGL
jgi:hypothetical protein